MTDSFTTAKPAVFATPTPIGTRVVLVSDVDNFPTLFVKAGETGILDRIDGEGSYWIKLDRHFPELNEWKNQLQIWDWSDENEGRFHPETFIRAESLEDTIAACLRPPHYTRAIRFWTWPVNDGGPVKITMEAGQTLRHHHYQETDEGHFAHSRMWAFDGVNLRIHWHTDESDCDGRMTRTGTRMCPAADVRSGDADIEHTYAVYPQWQDEESSQRDFAAEAMGY